jgi:hypothetical protein
MAPGARAQHVLANCCGRHRAPCQIEQRESSADLGCLPLIQPALTPATHLFGEAKFHARSRIAAILVGVDLLSTFLACYGTANHNNHDMPGEASDGLISSRLSLQSSFSSSASTTVAEEAVCWSSAAVGSGGATSFNAKKPSDVCCRGTCASSPKHAPSATRCETLAQKYPSTPGCPVCNAGGPAMLVDGQRDGVEASGQRRGQEDESVRCCTRTQTA